MLSTILKSAAILLTLSTAAMAQEVQPEINNHKGIIASEVHESPKVGPQPKDVVIVHKTNKNTQCPTGWTVEAGVCLPIWCWQPLTTNVGY